MSLYNIKASRLARALEGKVGLDFRQGKERSAWFWLDGQKRLRVTAPKQHAGDVPIGTAKSIRQQLRLGTGDFNRLVECPMTGNDYRGLMREKIARGLI